MKIVRRVVREENGHSISAVTDVVTEGVATLQSEATATRRDRSKTLNLVAATNYAVWDEYGLTNAVKTMEEFDAMEKTLKDATVFTAAVNFTFMNNFL